MYFTTKQFSANKTSKVMSTEISNLVRGSRSPFVRVYSDACDEGLILMSHLTGKKATFYINHVERDQEGDTLWWTLLPTVETIHEQPQLRGWQIKLFND